MKLIEKYKKYIAKKYFKWNKPKALTWDAWEDWHESTKNSQPWAYWFYETLPNFFSSCKGKITDPIKDTRYWIRVRLLDRYHVINTGLKPGYHEFEERSLHGMFNMLVDYVECELAWKSAIFGDADKKKYPWWSKGWFRFKNARMPTCGIDHLKWESTLDSPNLPSGGRSDWQAEKARIVLDLYHWWKYVRPLRKDPMDLSGWSDICDEKRKRGIKPLSNKGMTKQDKQREREALDKCQAIEQAYDDEDTEQLIRLVKIRKGLWT